MLMRMKWLGVLPVILTIALSACRNEGGRKAPSVEESEPIDTLLTDSVSEMEEEIEEAVDRIDGTFDDFLYAFIHSRRFFYKRIRYPLTLHKIDGEEISMETSNLHDEFTFLEGDYYTVLYGDVHQIGEEHKDSTVRIERIDLDNGLVRSFLFCREEGEWRLCRVQDGGLDMTGLGDFLNFYSRFSTDSIFQMQHVAQPVSISIIDPDDDSMYIEGTIDAEQWGSFCPELPRGVISNIRYGQGYGAYQVVMEKCGTANGLQDIFTFQREGRGWQLTAYEN